MSYSQFELDAMRVADDLNTCKHEDAAAVLRQEMYYNPLEFNTFLWEVNRLSSPARRDDVVYDSSGQVVVKDRYTGQVVVAGYPGGVGLPPTLPPIVLSTGGYGGG
jgi:hypothetical protein